MRILMLGNSFTYFHDMPSTLAQLTGAEVVAHTRGGAYLAEQLNPETEIGARTMKALKEETWDYVVLQEQSNAAVTSKEAFMKSVSRLCELSRQAGATPVLYATWAYQKGSSRIQELGIPYDVMASQMSASYHEAGELNNALVADVGQKFYKLSLTENLYEEDGSHPNEVGSRIAAETIAEVIQKDQKRSDERRHR